MTPATKPQTAVLIKAFTALNLGRPQQAECDLADALEECRLLGEEPEDAVLFAFDWLRHGHPERAKDAISKALLI